MHEVYHWKCIAETCVCRRDQFECPRFKQVATTIAPEEIDRLRAERDAMREALEKWRAAREAFLALPPIGPEPENRVPSDIWQALATGEQDLYQLANRAALAPSPARQGSIPDRTFERDLAELRAVDRMRAERDSLREALELLVRRLDNIWTKSNLASVFLIADRHGIKYTGETWIEPLDKARAALNPSPAGEKS